MNRLVVGAQWGDEGKGKIVDILAKDVDIVVRYQGGSNAGHTVCVGDQTFILHLIPSGILHPGKICVIGNGVVVDPASFLEEKETLEKLGIDLDNRVLISQKAHLVMPYHKVLDTLKEESIRKTKIGTTKRGIGPCYVDKHARTGIRVCDMLEPDLLKSKIEHNVAEINRLLKHHNQEEFSANEIYETYLKYAQKLSPFIENTVYYLNEAWKQGKRLLFEGAQGCLLDVDFGTYPFVTSSNPTVGGLFTGTGLSHKALDRVMGVVKAYTTRVGNGPFPSELTDELGDEIRNRGSEYGATTGRPRRCGWLDLVLVKYAVMLNGMDEIAMTKIDVLDGLDEIMVCVAYELDGKRIEYVPSSLSEFGRCKPIYERFKGWEKTAGVETYDALPKEAMEYIRFIEEYLGIPVTYVSTGSKRSQIIAR